MARDLEQHRRESAGDYDGDEPLCGHGSGPRRRPRLEGYFSRHSRPSNAAAKRKCGLQAARFIGVCAASMIAQVTVDMPGGYFGSADQVTPFGWGYSCLLLVLAVVATAGLWRERPWAHLVVPVLLSLNVGAFIPPMVADPLISGVVLLWNLFVLLQQLFQPTGRGQPLPGEEESTTGRWLFVHGPAARHVAAVALALTVGVVGYGLSHQLLAQLVCLALNLGSVAIAGSFLWLLPRRGRWCAVGLAAALTASVFFVPHPALLLSALALAQALLLALLIGRTRVAGEVLRYFLDHPARLVIASFLSLILLGTVLLTFPAASASGHSVSAIDALFTSTSATCVTGLVVLDTPKDFSPLGHAILLGLIQVGGLGIMVLSTFATLLLGATLGLRGERALSEMLDTQPGRAAYLLTRFIVLSTLAIEASGAVLLALCFGARGSSVGQAIWRGIFHSVSAFCNAGFALQSDSIVMFQDSGWALLVFAALIVLGGLGFPVLATLGASVSRSPRRVWPVHVRTVLVVSALLVGFGWLLYAAIEWNRSLADLTIAHKLGNSLFQSVTARTAGFNSVDLVRLAPATALLMAALMFIGASPGSTGGGIKTTTAVVLLAAVRSATRGGGPVTVFGREVSREAVDRSLAIAVTGLALTAVGLMLLLLVETQPFDILAFEAVSAMGTVGLSLGATAKLGAAAKLIVVSLMFAGRVGPLTLALLLGSGSPRMPKYRYPRARIMVG